MSGDDAVAFVLSLRDREGTGWRDPRHIATETFREGVTEQLSRDPLLDGGIVCCELYLTEDLPKVDDFCGIFAVDGLGIWYYDGDGHVADPVWRQHLLPWRYVRTMILHQVS